jgi:histidine triad (HIT) family protein
MANAVNADECIFCRIVRGDFDTEFLVQNELAVAFRDLHPQAPSHMLVVPRRHLGALRELSDRDADLALALWLMANDVAEQEGLYATGYRVLTNDGPDAGQSVAHLHLHVLGGRRLGDGFG